MSDNPNGERQVSPVGGGSKWLKSHKSRRALIAVACVGAIGFVAMGLYSAAVDRGPAEKPSDTGSQSIAQVTPAPPIPPAVAPPKPVEPPAPLIIYRSAPTTPTSNVPTVVAGATNFVRFPGAGGEEMFDVLASPASKLAGDATSQAAGEGAKASLAKTAVSFKPSIVAGGKAGPAIHLTYVMMPQLIPCALDTAMDSTLAGAIMCHTTTDVLSPDHVLLLGAGTVVVGQYKNDVRNGQSRLFAFSGNAITKEGIPVPLDSAIADGLGRAGIEGDVDNRFFQRFGAALMLTAAEAAVSIAQTEASKAGQTSLNLNSGGGVGGIASQILQSQISIPPLITVPPGSIVSIVVDHPIDFSDALHVTTTR